MRRNLTLVITLLGVFLMAAGIGSGRKGAVVIGICVAGVAAQQWVAIRMRMRREGRDPR